MERKNIFMKTFHFKNGRNWFYFSISFLNFSIFISFYS